MGCVSEAGCLGPRRREREVYIDLIESIHQEALTISTVSGTSSYSTPTSTSSPAHPVGTDTVDDLYLRIRYKLIKKGLLRKLLDNLASHRTHIHDSMVNNFRLVSQSECLYSKTAGLVVVDYMIASIYKSADSIEPRGDKSPADYSTHKTGSSNKLIMKSPRGKKEYVKSLQLSLSNYVDLRFDQAYFRLVIYLLESYPRAYRRVLQSISTFCSKRNDKFNCQNDIVRTLELLLLRLQENTYLVYSSHCYSLLTTKLKDNSKDRLSQFRYISFFLQAWLRLSRDYQHAYAITISNNYETIIRQILNRCLYSWYTRSLYRAIFALYDSYSFTENSIGYLENMLVNSSKYNDLHEQFLRGMFMQLIDYLTCKDGKRNRTLERSLRKKYSLRYSSQMYTYHEYDWPNKYTQTTKVNGFQTLRRWCCKQYVYLDEIVAYNGSALLNTYRSCLEDANKYLAQYLKKEFFKLTSLMSIKSRQIMVNLLIYYLRYLSRDDTSANFKSSNTTHIYKCNIVLTMIREYITSHYVLNNLPYSFNYFICLYSTHSSEQRLQLLQLMGCLVKHQPQLENTSSHPVYYMCEFLHSLYEVLANLYQQRDDDDALSRYQLANVVISFLRCLVEKGESLIVIAFLQKVIEKMQNEESTVIAPLAKVVNYLLLYLVYEVRHLMNKKMLLPIHISKLNESISPHVSAKDLKRYMYKCVDSLLLYFSQGYKTQRNSYDSYLTLIYRNDAKTHLFSNILSSLGQLSLLLRINYNDLTIIHEMFLNYFTQTGKYRKKDKSDDQERYSKMSDKKDNQYLFYTYDVSFQYIMDRLRT